MMPYIPPQDQGAWSDAMYAVLDKIRRHGISNGELNFLFTTLCVAFIDRHSTSYNTIADVIKALECAKLEFYRRVAVPYEDKKIEQNGDVYS
jgi:hypothetical protein